MPGTLKLIHSPGHLSQNIVPPTDIQHRCARGFYLPLFCTRKLLHYVRPINRDVLGKAGRIASQAERTERKGHKNPGRIRGLAILCGI